MCSYYCTFATSSHPLTLLMVKGVKFTWSGECQAAFKQLNLLLKTALVLAYPDLLTLICLDIDASADLARNELLHHAERVASSSLQGVEVSNLSSRGTFHCSDHP